MNLFTSRVLPKRISSTATSLIISLPFILLFLCPPATAQRPRSPAPCPRFQEGSILANPAERRSTNGLLQLTLKFRNSIDEHGDTRYCYIDEYGNQSPTLRLHPGDTLKLTLRNEISHSTTKQIRLPRDPCKGGAMSTSSTNLHFHGLAIRPVCHQDETLKTMIQPGDPPFEYRIQIPRDQPPGLYWYHPHIHGFTEDQVLGGASGAIIIEGIEHVNSQLQGLEERVLIIRDQKMPGPFPSDQPDPNRPTKQLSINYVPAPYPKYPPAIIKMKPSERQFWRMLNASADTYLDLRVEFNGKPQSFSVIALDGVPLVYGRGGSSDYAPQQIHLTLPPAGRAELIVTGPPEGVQDLLMTSRVYRGAADENTAVPLPINKNDPNLRTGQDDVDPTRPLAILSPSNDLPPRAVPPASASRVANNGNVPLSAVRPERKRTLYFSEKVVDPGDPKNGTQFLITEEGQTPAPFDAHTAAPNITVHQGDVEDWTIENRSQESHAFHIHQLHFLVVGARAVPWEEPALRDTINLPAWDGVQRYPSVTLRMDFRDRNLLGIIPYHCHIMQHIDGGMMGTVRVEP